MAPFVPPRAPDSTVRRSNTMTNERSWLAHPARTLKFALQLAHVCLLVSTLFVGRLLFRTGGALLRNLLLVLDLLLRNLVLCILNGGLELLPRRAEKRRDVV